MAGGNVTVGRMGAYKGPLGNERSVAESRGSLKSGLPPEEDLVVPLRAETASRDILDQCLHV